MPSQKIYQRNVPGEDASTYLRVGWAHDLEQVQVAALLTDAPWRWAMVDKTADPDAVFDGYWISLDRAQVNELIRVLRRARDASFGADA